MTKKKLDKGTKKLFDSNFEKILDYLSEKNLEVIERKPSKDLTDDDVIEQFLHCKLCGNDIISGAVKDTSPRDYARFSIGWTVQGLQVWCNRHNVNVMHIDFEGIQHPANLQRKPMKYEEDLK